MAVVSLVLGIIAIVIGVFTSGVLGWLGGIIGIIGIVFGALARKNNPSGMATAGFVCSIVGTVLSLLFYLACIACIGAGSAAASSNCALAGIIL
jgi:hypothetical protein